MSTTRITYRRKHVYKTRSNNVRRFRTPGGRLLVQVRSKRTSSPICGDTKLPLNGIKRVHPAKFRNLAHRQRTVSRPYGGSLSHDAVKFRYLAYNSVES
jgi:large subunit ribosomal protein L34e